MNTFNKTAAKNLAGKTITYNGETKVTFAIADYNPKTNLFALVNLESETTHELHLEGLNRMIKQDNKMKHANPFVTFGE